MELKKCDITKFKIGQIPNDGNVVCDGQNLRVDNLEPHMVKHLIAKLRNMAELQLVKSEMEKKYLLYHILRNNLELEQMKSQISIMPESNDMLDLLGLTGIAPCFLPEQTRRCKTPRFRSSSSERDYTNDNNSDGELSNEDQKAWRIVQKLLDIPEIPELTPTNHPWGDGVRKMPQKNKEFVKDAYEASNLHENWDEDQVLAWLGGNQRQGRKPINSTLDTHISQNQKSNGELLKTEICRSWAQFGMCQYGLNCHFAHGRGELRVKPKPHFRYKTEMCKKFLAGYCPYGSRCCFVHHPNEAMIIKGRSLGVESYSELNMDMTRRWQRRPASFDR